MIDNQDKQTQPLDLGTEPKRRGRPAKQNALSNAERQRRYREAQKAQKAGEGMVDGKRLIAAEREIQAYKEAVAELCDRIKFQEKYIKDLKAQLEQRNEKPSRLNEGMKKLIQDVHDVADAIEGSTWRIQKKSKGGKWKTLMGNYWTEAQAIDAIMDLPGGGPHDQYRAIEVNLKIED